MQALYSQRNIAANAQRKYAVSYTIMSTGGDMSIVPGHPVELKDVLIYAPSPSGVLLEDIVLVDAGLQAILPLIALDFEHELNRQQPMMLRHVQARCYWL